MNIVEKYDYPSLKRDDSNKTRLYKTPDGDFPSVTTILDKTKDKTFLFEWRKRVGDEEANRISKEAAGLGTVFHKHLENYIDNEERPNGSNFVYKLAKDMSDIIIEKGLSNVDEGVPSKDVLITGIPPVSGQQSGPSQGIQGHKDTRHLALGSLIFAPSS